MKYIPRCIVLFLLLSIMPAYADGMPDIATRTHLKIAEKIPVDNRIKILTYNPQDVYMVPTKYGYQTSIVFAHNEEIKTVSVGDRSMWQIIPSGNRMFIRPMDDGLATNMTIITNIREYNFDIKSIASDQTNNLYVVQFRYPEDKNTLEDSLNDGEMPTSVAESSLSNDLISIPPLDTQRTQNINENYSYTGHDNLAPTQVYDDGRNTYVLYDAMPSPAPRPIVTSTSGKSAMARHDIDGNKIIIYTVVKGFVLKSSGGEITVYNELFHP